MKITVLPWRNTSELAFVRDSFFPEHITTSSSDIYTLPPTSPSTLTASQTKLKNYELALQRVQIWTFRSPRSVPHAITATAALIEATVHDELGFGREATITLLHWTQDGIQHDNDEPRGFTISETALRSIYAMAFLKFVNGFVDRDVSRSNRRTGLSRTKLGVVAGDDDEEEGGSDEDAGAVPLVKAQGESSMYAHAASIGMPSRFVDLRHRCVHGEVPGLGELREVSGLALEWLWDRWWKGNAEGDAGRWKWEMEESKRRKRRFEEVMERGGNTDNAGVRVLDEMEE